MYSFLLKESTIGLWSHSFGEDVIKKFYIIILIVANLDVISKYFRKFEVSCPMHIFFFFFFFFVITLSAVSLAVLQYFYANLGWNFYGCFSDYWGSAGGFLFLQYSGDVV